MLQRIQSVYLLLCALCFIIAGFLPIVNYHFGADNYYALSALGVKAYGADLGSIKMIFKPFYVLPFIVFITVYSIFKFKNRKQQLKLVHFNYLLILGYIVAMYFAMDAVEDYLDGVEKSVSHTAGFYLPVVGLAFNFLASRGIKKDEELVKSIDRIR
jgi:hypothetical protein